MARVRLTSIHDSGARCRHLHRWRHHRHGLVVSGTGVRYGPDMLSGRNRPRPSNGKPRSGIESRWRLRPWWWQKQRPQRRTLRRQGGRGGEQHRPWAVLPLGAHRAGVLSGTGSPADLAAQDAVLQKMMDDYGVASAFNQRLSAADWMQKQYGAGWQGKKGKNFQGGTLSALQGPNAEQIQNQIANASPGTTIQSQLMNRGPMPGAGNDAFTQWLQTAYVPQQEAATTSSSRAETRRSTPATSRRDSTWTSTAFPAGRTCIASPARTPQPAVAGHGGREPAMWGGGEGPTCIRRHRSFGPPR